MCSKPLHSLQKRANDVYAVRSSAHSIDFCPDSAWKPTTVCSSHLAGILNSINIARMLTNGSRDPVYSNVGLGFADQGLFAKYAKCGKVDAETSLITAG
jgi:hypothetical protein